MKFVHQCDSNTSKCEKGVEQSCKRSELKNIYLRRKEIRKSFLFKYSRQADFTVSTASEQQCKCNEPRPGCGKMGIFLRASLLQD